MLDLSTFFALLLPVNSSSPLTGRCVTDYVVACMDAASTVCHSTACCCSQPVQMISLHVVAVQVRSY